MNQQAQRDIKRKLRVLHNAEKTKTYPKHVGISGSRGRHSTSGKEAIFKMVKRI